MRLASISITNMAGFAKFETKLPSVVLIQGRNGEGKTSLLDCVRYTFGRGHDPDMIHGSEKEGEILIELDNGAAVKCRSTRDPAMTFRSWRAAGAKKFVISREQIDAVSKAISYDPLAFMDLPEKEQVENLLRVMPIECGDEEIKETLGGAEISIPAGGTALDRIDMVRKTCYDRRRDFNVSADGKEKHAGELERSLPPDAPDGDWSRIVDALEADRNALDIQRQTALAELRKEFEAAKVVIDGAYERDAEVARQLRDKRLEELRATSNSKASEMGQEVNTKLHVVVAELSTAKERARAQSQAEGTKKALAAAKQAAERDRAHAKTLTEAMERLDLLKKTVASRLPIQDIVIQDGRILRKEGENLVPFSRWNTEAKMRFCLRVAVLAHAEAGFVCIDHAEAFDADKRKALLSTAEKYAEKDGMQFLIASVADRPLTVGAATGE